MWTVDDEELAMWIGLLRYCRRAPLPTTPVPHWPSTPMIEAGQERGQERAGRNYGPTRIFSFPFINQDLAERGSRGHVGLRLQGLAARVLSSVLEAFNSVEHIMRDVNNG